MLFHAELLEAGLPFCDAICLVGADLCWNILVPRVIAEVFQLAAYMDDVAIPILEMAKPFWATFAVLLKLPSVYSPDFDLRLTSPFTKPM